MLIEVVAYSSATRFSFMGEGSVLRDRERAYRGSKTAAWSMPFHLDENIRWLALDEVDLQPLWDWISGLE
jgi:hypothetical protein